MTSSFTSKRFVSILGLMLAFSVVLLFFVGCSSSPTKYADQTVVDGKFEYLLDVTDFDGQFRSPILFEELEAVTSEVVGLLGGEIAVDLGDSEAEFVVPFGALLRSTEITLDVTKIRTPLGPIFIYDCGPDGTIFKNPAKLIQPMPEGQETASIYYFNEVTRSWELQEVVRVKDGVAVFKIKHFSKYGIS